jgi:putative component of membrane protein insertase Oxa1/YidC/SpoIIIJ protein YidD
MVAVEVAARFPVPEALDQLAAGAAVGAIGFYRRFISRHSGKACLFRPTCSQRAMTFLSEHGLRAGMKLTLTQLHRCGGNYSISTNVLGETLLVTADGLRFGPDEISQDVLNARAKPQSRGLR